MADRPAGRLGGRCLERPFPSWSRGERMLGQLTAVFQADELITSSKFNVQAHLQGGRAELCSAKRRTV